MLSSPSKRKCQKRQPTRSRIEFYKERKSSASHEAAYTLSLSPSFCVPIFYLLYCDSYINILTIPFLCIFLCYNLHSYESLCHCSKIITLYLISCGFRLEVCLLGKLASFYQIRVGTHYGSQPIVRHRCRQQCEDVAENDCIQLSTSIVEEVEMAAQAFTEGIAAVIYIIIHLF